MNTRNALACLLGGLGGWLMWQSFWIITGAVEASDGSQTLAQIVFNPEYTVRIIVAITAWICGLAAIVGENGRRLLIMLASFIFGVLVFGVIAYRVEMANWREEMIMMILLTGLALTMVIASQPRAPRTETSEQAEADEDEEDSMARATSA
jgi:hypothetical protein